jgi:hypothetical protein
VVSSYSEPIGYMWNGELWCRACLEKDPAVNPSDPEVDALFDYSESDYPLHCGDCHVFLGGVLTNYGKMWLRDEWVLRGWRNFEVVEVYMRHYHMDWYFVFNLWGWTDPLGNLEDV